MLDNTARIYSKPFSHLPLISFSFWSICSLVIDGTDLRNDDALGFVGNKFCSSSVTSKVNKINSTSTFFANIGLWYHNVYSGIIWYYSSFYHGMHAFVP